MKLLPLSLVLLQHASELKRPTGTGKLLAHETLQPHLQLRQWTWAGRADNDDIERRMAELTAPVLLWTSSGGGGGASAAEATPPAAEAELPKPPPEPPAVGELLPPPEPPATSPPAAEGDYIILDGTWQEALQIFRKGPDCLRACPRAALAAGPSRYILRADYGWRERFGASGDAEPLCTAEAAASLLEQRGGDEAGGAAVRALLDDFQREYAEAHPHLHPHLVQFAARAPGRGLEFRPSRPAGIERTAPALCERHLFQPPS